MSITDRKNKEKLEMRKRILNGARRVFLEKGYENTSMRNIASEIDYSAGTLYFHFKDKSEIFHELHKEGFRLLLDQLMILESVADPFERLKAVGKVFIKFAQENKDYYNLMFLVNEPSSEKSDNNGFQIAQEAINHLLKLVKDCQEEGRFKNMDPEYFSFMFLSSVNGICALFCKDRSLNFADKTDEDLMINGYDYFISFLEKG